MLSSLQPENLAAPAAETYNQLLLLYVNHISLSIIIWTKRRFPYPLFGQRGNVFLSAFFQLRSIFTPVVLYPLVTVLPSALTHRIVYL